MTTEWDRAASKALALCRARRFDEADQALAAEPIGGSSQFLCRGRVSLLAGRSGDAREHAKHALAIAPGLTRAHLLLARLAKQSGKPGAQVTHLLAALTQRPEAASLRATIAELMRVQGQLDDALAMARAALKRDPACHAASLVVAHCHLARGNQLHARLAVARIARDRPGWSALTPFLSEPMSASAPVSLEPARPAPAVRLHQAQPSSVLDHACILRAIMLRGLALKHSGNPLWLPLELVRPTAVVVAHWVLFAVVHKPMPGQIPIPLFVLAGFSVWFAFNYAAMGAANAVKFPTATIVWPGITPMHLRLARAGWPLLVNLCFCLLGILPFRLFRSDLAPPDLPLTVLVFAIAGAGGIGYGIITDRLAAVAPAVSVIEKLLTWALFVTSGLYFVVYNSGPLAGNLLLLNPLLHLIEFERHAFDPGYPLTLVSLWYPALVAACLLTLGAASTLSLRQAR